MLRYTLLRILLFLFFLCGFWLVAELAHLDLGAMGTFWLVVAAALASMVASLFWLKAPRADFNEQIDEAIARREAKRQRRAADSDEALEDELVEGDSRDRRVRPGAGDDFV